MNGGITYIALTPYTSDSAQKKKKKKKVIYLAKDGLHSVGVKTHLTLPAELLIVHLSRVFFKKRKTII